MTSASDKATAALAAELALEAAETSGQPVMLRDVINALGSGRGQMPPHVSAALFRNPRLAADFRLILRRLARGANVVAMPAQAAAATPEEVIERPLGNGTLLLVPSDIPGEARLLLRFSGDVPAGSVLLTLSGADTGAVQRVLPAPDARGEIYVLLDLERPEDRVLSDLLRAPGTEGILLPLE